jgi:cytochrome P450
LVWQGTVIFYNLHLHPLRSFPGPLLSRATPFAFAFQLVSGVQYLETQKLHERYGPVVRIGPKHLSFTDPRAWKDIYGHRVGADSSEAVEMPKTDTFNRSIEMPTSILNADREEHQRTRRALAHGFSDGSMRQQEPSEPNFPNLLGLSRSIVSSS